MMMDTMRCGSKRTTLRASHAIKIQSGNNNTSTRNSMCCVFRKMSSTRLSRCWVTTIMMMMMMSNLGMVTSFYQNQYRRDGWRNIHQLRDDRQSEKAVTPPTVSSCSKQRTTMTRYMTAEQSTETGAKSVLPWTRETLEEYASQQGIVLSLSTLGPGYRALARAKHNTTLILGYVEGFVRPSGKVLHLDKMQVFSKIVQQARLENPEEFKGGGTIFGPGLLVGYLCLLFGAERGCRVAEFLAIDDAEFQHKRLVRFYKNSGFDVVKYVGEDFKDIPDRLVWGGCGTLLRKDIPTLLDFWTRLLERNK